jgi:hypothetical protein
MKIRNKIRNLDIFSTQLKLPISYPNTSQTMIGGLQTIIMFSMIICLSWLIGKDIIYKLNPFAFSQVSQSELFPEILVTKESFPFAINLIDVKNNPLQYKTRYFNLSLDYIKYDYDASGKLSTNLQSVPLVQCKFDHFPQISHEQFSSAVLDTFLCPENLNFSLQGNWGEKHTHFFNIMVRLCDYDSTPDKCEKPEDIKKFIRDNLVMFEITYLESFYNLKNFSNPKQTYTHLAYKYLDFEKCKQSTIFLKNSTLTTDEGFMLEQKQSMSFLEYDESLSDYLDVTSSKKIIGIFIQPSNMITTFFRNYIKLQDILAGVGGIIRSIMFLFMIFNKTFLDSYTYQSIMNEIFRFNDPKKEEKRKKIQNESFMKEMSSEKIIIHHKESRSKILIDQIKKEKNITIESPKDYLLNLHFSEIIFLKCSKFNKNNPNIKIFRLANRRFNEIFNIVHLLKEIQKSNFLSQIILDKSQYSLFNILSAEKIGHKKLLIGDNRIEEVVNNVKKKAYLNPQDQISINLVENLNSII